MYKSGLGNFPVDEFVSMSKEHTTKGAISSRYGLERLPIATEKINVDVRDVVLPQATLASSHPVL